MSRRLVADDLDDLTFGEDSGVYVKAHDIGFPEARGVESFRVGLDGVDDRSAFHGARAVTLDATVVAGTPGTRQQILDRLSAFCHPRRRAYLYFQDEVTEAERRILLRGDGMSRPISRPGFVRVQLAFRAPDGVQESADEVTEYAPASSGVEGGRTYPRTYPRVYVSTGIAGSAVIGNDGNTDALPVIRIYGPCTNPRIENDTVGKTLEFGNADAGDLTIEAGSYIEIDVRERTVTLEGDASNSRYQYLDFAASEWWALEPGDNEVRFYPESFEAGCTAVLLYRHTWI